MQFHNYFIVTQSVVFRLKIAFLAPITILTTMKPILCAAFAAAFVTAILANDDPLKAVPAGDERPTVKPAVPAPTVDLPTKPNGTGLNEILRAGKLPVIGNIDGPFSGKLTLLGDDG